MHVFGVLVCSLCVLVLPFDVNGEEITVEVTYYMESEGGIINTSDVNDISRKEFDRLVIDLTTSHYIYGVKVKYLTSTKNLAKNLSTVIFTRSEIRVNGCPLIDSENECNRVSRLLVIDGKGDVEELKIYEIFIHGYEAKAEYYFGCFRALNVSKSFESITYLDDCEIRCPESPFYGLNANGRCVCVGGLTEIATAKSDLCYKKCPDTVLFCGGDEFHSIYSKSLFHTNQEPFYPPMECILDRINCTCPKGRMGLNCEFIDCSVRNGNCGDLLCLNEVVEEGLMIGFCACEDGFQMTSNFSCYDVDECRYDICESNSTACKNSEGSFACDCLQDFKRLNQYRCEEIAKDNGFAVIPFVNLPLLITVLLCSCIFHLVHINSSFTL